MLIYDEKKFFDKMQKDFEPCCPPNPHHTIPEKVDWTARQLRDTLDRLMMFEKTITDKYENLMSVMTQDNVTFKDLMQDAWSDFVASVQSEVNLYETNIDSMIALFKQAVNDRLTEFNENHSQAFEDYQTALSTRMDEYLDDIWKQFNEYKQTMANVYNEFTGTVNNRLTTQDNKISDAEMYMKTNLNTSLDNLLHEMSDNGEIEGIMESTVMVNAKKIGASGDGVTDDTPYLKNLIKEAEDGNKLAYVPAGTYLINETLDIPDNVRLAGSNENVVIKKSTQGEAIKLGAFACISNVTIDGCDVANGITFNGGRCYVHDVTVKNCAEGLLTNSTHSNLSRAYRITLLDCDTAIALHNENNSNSQSLTFCDIDIRGCRIGLECSQPGNKFINLCVQNGVVGGKAIIINDGANNNIFVGTYLENSDYSAEVDFTTSKYNQFIGGRPIQYGNSFINNDGTNMVLTRSIQYAEAMFERGTTVYKNMGVIAKETDEGLPSAILTAKHNGDNKILLDTYGTSIPTEVDFGKVRVKEDNLIHRIGDRGYKGFGMIKYTPSYASFANGETVTGFTSVIGNADMLNAQCNLGGVNVWIEQIEGGQHKLTLKNESGKDLSNQTIPITIIYSTNC